MITNGHVGRLGKQLIHHFEGRTPYAYNDPVGFCTAGPGILLHRSRCTSADYAKYGSRVAPKITERVYDEMFNRAARPREVQLADMIGARRMRTTQAHEFSAMFALLWNIGASAFASSSVLRLHKARMGFAAGAAFLLWNKAGGRCLDGLVRRRMSERHLYRKGELKLFVGDPRARC